MRFDHGRLYRALTLAGSRAPRWALCFGLALTLLIASRCASAQDDAAAGYKTQTPYQFKDAQGRPDRIKEGRIKQQVRQMLNGQSVNENKPTFDAYYTKVLFPAMTLTTEQALQDLPRDRYGVIRDLEGCSDSEVHEHLADLVFTFFTPVVQENYHPAVRYNALLLIGSLNETEAVRIGSAKRILETHPRALPILVAELERPENTDLLRVAALWGIKRHMDWDAYRSAPLPAAARTAAVSALLKLATAKEAPAGRSPEGHAWMRRRAIEALGYASTAKIDPPVATAFTTILVDDAEPLEVRCAVAGAIGHSAYVAPATLDVPTTVRELGRLAVIACNTELSQAAKRNTEEEERKKLLSAVPQGGGAFGDPMMGGAAMPAMPAEPLPGFDPMGMGMGGIGMAPAKPEDPKAYRVDYLRRRMRARLANVQTAFRGPLDRDNAQLGVEKAAKQPNDKKMLTDVVAKLEDVIRVIEQSEMDFAKLETDLKSKLAPLEALTVRPSPKPGAGDAGPADDLPGGDAPGAGVRAAAPPGGGSAAATRPVAATAAP